MMVYTNRLLILNYLKRTKINDLLGFTCKLIFRMILNILQKININLS